MSNIIEIEASYHLDDNYENILNKIEEAKFKFLKDIVEEDTYFTDKDMIFIKDRICLRTRKINEDFLELTYKPKTDNNTEKYGKREVNLRIDAKDYIDTKYIIEELGYIEYVSFKKHRKIYTKTIDNFELVSLQKVIFKNGELVYDDPDILEKKEYCDKQMKTLYPEVRRTDMPHIYPVSGTKDYVELKKKLILEHRNKIRG